MSSIMATTTEPGSKSKSRSTKSEKKAKPTQPNSAATDKLKTVVRRLPPNLPEDVFWQSVQPWVSDEIVSWKVFYPGKIRKKYNKENISSRAYIAFRSAEQLAAFSQAYDGHVFRDKAGNESFAVVEFAPCQKVPPEKRKADPRNGTIEQDEDFISFITSLNAPPSKPSESETVEALGKLVSASQPSQEPKSTPLLDALRAEKQAERETIYYQHEAAARRRGKQPQPPAERDDGAPASAPGQGKRSRRGGGKKGGTVAPKDRDKETPQAQRERRARPTIALGGASLLEAALSGAGVIREREREKKTGPGDAPKTQTDGADKDKPQGPASPGRERNRGGRKRGDSVRVSTGVSAPPVILSRASGPGPSAILARPATVSGDTSAPPSPGVGGRGPPAGGEGRGGRRRGGRGRGPPSGLAARTGAPEGGALKHVH